MRSIFDRRRRRKRKGRGDCGTPECGDCGDCSPFLLGVVLVAAANYSSTPPVVGGARSMRPALRLIRSYQANVSAHRPARCNLEPTCSNYGYAVLRDHGVQGLPALRRRLRECADAGRRAG